MRLRRSQRIRQPQLFKAPAHRKPSRLLRQTVQPRLRRRRRRKRPPSRNKSPKAQLRMQPPAKPPPTSKRHPRAANRIPRQRRVPNQRPDRLQQICPPPKVIVRNGGTAEGTVQLTGGTVAANNSPQRANTERLMVSTEDELKTTAGHQLDSTQQETVKQIHQYQTQSKTALQAGDL